MDRNVNIITDLDGNKIVLINDIRFKAKKREDWKDVEEYLKEYVEEFYEIAETSEKIFISTDFPDEYANSESRMALKGAVAKAKANSKKAYAWDNACIESFHSLIKREWLNRFKIRDYDHAYRLIFEYLEAFYNTKRIHSHCDYMSPNDYEELYRRLQQDELQLAG